MARADVTSAFILTSSIAILASNQVSLGPAACRQSLISRKTTEEQHFYPKERPTSLDMASSVLLVPWWLRVAWTWRRASVSA